MRIIGLSEFIVGDHEVVNAYTSRTSGLVKDSAERWNKGKKDHDGAVEKKFQIGLEDSYFLVRYWKTGKD